MKKIDLVSVIHWSMSEPETISWHYLFTDTEYCLYAETFDYLKDNYWEEAIMVGSYTLKNNKIYLDGNSSANFVYVGDGSFEETDQAGTGYTVTGKYFVPAAGAPYPKYVAAGIGSLEENKELLKKLKALKQTRK
jgi:hypothetical protein